MAALVLAAATFAQFSWAQAGQSAEVSIDRHFQLHGLLPIEGQYVSYSANVKNTGNTVITGMRLWTTFGSATGSESTSFAIPDLQPEQTKQLSLGPFKMVKSGEHRLYLGINRSGSASEPNDVSLNYSPDAPADLIAVYSAGLMSAISAGAAFAAAGAVLVALYVKKRQA